MSVSIKEVHNFIVSKERYRWLNDSDIDRYIGFSEELKLGDNQELDELIERHFELYIDDEHIGDVRTKYNTEEDKVSKSAEFYIIIGSRNSGIGSKVFPIFINHVKKYYNQLYCTVHKSNIRSAKLMKKNNFYMDDIIGNDLLFKLDLK